MHHVYVCVYRYGFEYAQRLPMSGFTKDDANGNLLYVLACTPQVFQGRSQLRFWEKFACVPVLLFMRI